MLGDRLAVESVCSAAADLQALFNSPLPVCLRVVPEVIRRVEGSQYLCREVCSLVCQQPVERPRSGRDADSVGGGDPGRERRPRVVVRSLVRTVELVDDNVLVGVGLECSGQGRDPDQVLDSAKEGALSDGGRTENERRLLVPLFGPKFVRNLLLKLHR